MKINVYDDENPKKFFIEIDNLEALSLIQTLAKQLQSGNFNGDRTEYFTEENEYFTIAVVGEAKKPDMTVFRYSDWAPEVSVRLAVVLQEEKFASWEQVAQLSEREFLALRGVGRLTLTEAIVELEKVGLKFRVDSAKEKKCPECNTLFVANANQKYCKHSCGLLFRLRQLSDKQRKNNGIL